jgi:hypothetical protein
MSFSKPMRQADAIQLPTGFHIAPFGAISFRAPGSGKLACNWRFANAVGSFADPRDLEIQGG